MADSTKKKPTKYKFGQRELDMSEYLRHLGNNVQSYIEDRRKKKGWTDDLVKEFSDSYNRYMGAFRQQLDEGSSRFSTDDLGSIIDTKGEFSDIDNDGIDPGGSEYYYNDKGERITTDDYNALKDKKKKNYKTFAANREVARFFNIVGKGMADLKPEEKEKFDLGKHGFFSWWQKKYNPAGGAMNLKPFLDKDPVGADGKRAVTERAKMAAGWLGEYLSWLKDKDFDYSGYEQFPSYEAYSKLGEDLKLKWSDNNWDADDLIAGQAFGIDNDWARGFFTTEEDPNLTDAQREENKKKAEEEEEKKKQEDLKKSERDWIDQQYRIYEGSNPAYGAENRYTRMGMNLSDWYDHNNNFLEENYLKSWENTSPDQRQAYIDRFVQDPFNAAYSKDMARNIVTLVQEGLAQQIGGDGELAGQYYIPSKSDVARRRALIYDPSDHSMYYTFIGDVPHVWEKLHKSQFKEKHGLIDKYDKYSKLENGGILSYQIGGDLGNKLQLRRDRYIALKAAEKGVSVERYENDIRQPNGDQNLLNQNNGWTSADTAHAASLVADLTAAGLGLTGFTPASSITGAVGTTGHLTADIMEDGLDWGDVGRAAVGYGLDALALIPGASAFSQGAKIAKTVAKIAPRALAALGAMGAVANIGPITASFKKAMSSGPENKLTVEDYRNITQGLTLLMGGAGAAGRKFHNARNFPIKNRGPVAVKLRNKASGEVENKIFTGEQAKALSEAKDAKAMNEIIFKDHPELAGYELATRKELIPRLGKIRSDAGWFKEAGFRDAKPRVMRIRQDSKGNVYAENGPWEADIRLRDLTSRVKGERAYLNQQMADNRLVGDQLKHARAAAERFKTRKDAVKTAAETNKANAEAALNAERTAQSLAATENAATIRARQLAMEKAIAGDGSVPEQGLIAARGELANLTNQTRNASANYRRLRGLTGSITNSSRNAKQAVKDLQRQVALKQHEVAIAPDAASKAALQKQLDVLKVDLKTAQSAYKAASSKATKHAEKVKNAKNSRNSLKSSVQAKLKWLNENTTAKANDLKTRADKLESLEGSLNNATSRLDKLNQLISEGHTAAYKKLEAEAKANEGKIKFKDSAGREIVRDFQEIVKRYGLLKQGGKFSKVRSYGPGGGLGQPIRNVQSTANWYEHMYKDDPMQKWLSGFDKSNYRTFNSLQNSWISNKNETGYDPNNPDLAKGVGKGISENVKARQIQWNETGTNATIGKLRNDGTIVGRGGTTDTEEGNYTDGYFGAQEFLRHGGTHDAWEGHDEDLLKLKSAFKEKGLDYREDADGMFRLYELNGPEEPQETPQEEPLEQPDESKKTTPVEEDVEKEKEKPKSQGNPINFSKLRDTIDPMAIAGWIDADHTNNVNTARSIDAARKSLNLKNPRQMVRYYQPNVRHLIEGERQMGMLLKDVPNMTSDGAITQAAWKDRLMAGLDRQAAQAEKYNTSAEKERDLKAQVENLNEEYRHAATEANGDEFAELIDYIASAENARDQQNYLNRSALRKKIEYENDIERNTLKARIEQAQLDNLYSGVMNNPAAYGVQLTDKEQEMWNKKISGEITSSADITDPEDLKALRSAVLKVNEGFYMAQQMQMGVPQDANFNNRFGKIRGLVNNQSTDDEYKPTYKPSQKNGGILLKDGSKVDVAKIRARSKDADRVSKSISKSHDRAQKDRERIDRTNRKRYKLKDYR